MLLNCQTYTGIRSAAIELPSQDCLRLPEKVVQFGTGVLLRGLPDYYIDKANKQGIFNGRVVMIKSTAGGDINSFNAQDGLYTQCLRGITNGESVEHNILNAAVSRVLAADGEWHKVLELAQSVTLQLVVSNTTEVGIALVDDNIHALPPVSFPGKLLAFLYRRYQYFNGDTSKGLIVVPTELIPANASTLQSILFRLVEQNNLEQSFTQWLQNACIFCNSLVDRIVPGRLPAAEAAVMEAKLGYRDELMIMSEIYGLWAIETGDENVKRVLSFSQCDDGVIITPDISIHRELKLRLLNGSHTFTCGLAFLSGFSTVKDAMSNFYFASFITRLMMHEISHSISHESLAPEQAANFAAKVLDRFRNPFIAHKWLNITLHYTTKMNTRNAMLVKNYVTRNGNIPRYMSLSLAAWILFMKSEKAADGKYYGHAGGMQYLVSDNHAGFFSTLWKEHNVDDLVSAVFSNSEIWQYDLSLLPGLVPAVAENLQLMVQHGPLEMLRIMAMTE